MSELKKPSLAQLSPTKQAHRIHNECRGHDEATERSPARRTKRGPEEAPIRRGAECPLSAPIASQFRCFLAVISAVIYSNSLIGGFVYDDHRAILGNPNVVGSHSLHDWPRLLLDDFWGTPLGHSGSHKSWRPLVTLTFKLQALVHQALIGDQAATTAAGHEPSGWMAFSFHLANLLLHICVVDQVFLLANEHLPRLVEAYREGGELRASSCQGASSKSSPSSNGSHVTRRSPETNNTDSCSPTACIGSLVFACHPVHVEAVTSLVGRAELMGALFALLSFASLGRYLLACRQSRRRPYDSTLAPRQDAGASTGLRDGRPLYLARSAGWLALACASKENCGAAGLALNGLLIVWFASGHVTRAAPGRLIGRLVVAPSLVLLALACAFVALRIQLGRLSQVESPEAPEGEHRALASEVAPRFSLADNPLSQGPLGLCLAHGEGAEQLAGLLASDKQQDRLAAQEARRQLCNNPALLGQLHSAIRLTRLYLAAFSLKLLLWPHELSYDWPLASIGLVRSALEWRFVAALGLYGLAGALLATWMAGAVARSMASWRQVERLIGGGGGHSRCPTAGRPGSRSRSRSRATSAGRGSRLEPSPAEPPCRGARGEPDARGQVEALMARGRTKSPAASDEADGADAAGSESDGSSSVRSIDTIKTNDSGFGEPPAPADKENDKVKRPASRGERRRKRTQRRRRLHLGHVIENRAIGAGAPFGCTGDGSEPRRRTSEQGAGSHERRPLAAKQTDAKVNRAPATLHAAPNEPALLLLSIDIDHLAWPLLWLLLPLLPASNLLVWVGFLAAERALYLPSVGLSLLLAELLVWLGGGGGAGCCRCDGARVGAATKMGPAREFKRRPVGGGHRAAPIEGPMAVAVAAPPGTPVRGCSRRAVRLPLAAARIRFWVFIFPLLILGALKTFDRNWAWRDDAALFSSNLAQSRAKSMANLAWATSRQVGASRGPADVEDAQLERLYRGALELEPGSAELHYNLARLLQARTRGRPNPSVEYHYRLALKLRENFPLAALNLAVYQYEARPAQLEAPLETFASCGLQMKAQGTRDFHQHVQIQTECLISGARLLLFGTPTGAQGERGALGAAPARAACQRALDWMGRAEAKAAQIAQTKSTRGQHEHIGDWHQQMAHIYWIRGLCQPSGSVAERRRLFGRASELACQSGLAVEAQVYAGLAELELELGRQEAALETLRRAIGCEISKGGVAAPGRRSSLVSLYRRQARLELARGDPHEASATLHKALELHASGPADWRLLTFAGELAHATGQLEASARHFAAALEAVAASEAPANCSRKRATAHANLGASLQMLGRRSEAREHYRRALACDAANVAASTNLRRMGAR